MIRTILQMTLDIKVYQLLLACLLMFVSGYVVGKANRSADTKPKNIKRAYNEGYIDAVMGNKQHYTKCRKSK